MSLTASNGVCNGYYHHHVHKNGGYHHDDRKNGNSTTTNSQHPQQQHKSKSGSNEVESLQDRSYPLTSLIQPDLSDFNRSEVREYFLNSYKLNELVFSAIKKERYFYKSPDRLRLPLIFYLGHTATLYINKLILGGLLKERVNRHYEMLFETGVNEMSWDDTENYRMGGAFVWPTVAEVMKYRKEVCEVVLNVINTAPLQLPVTQDNPWWSLFMAIEHERIHFETSSVLINQLPVSMLSRPPTWQYAPNSMTTPAGPNEMIKVSSGKVVMGRPNDFPSFGWDNEYGSLSVQVPEFYASKYLITNREFQEFVQDNGYHKKEHWTEEGWKWVSFRRAEHPLYWVCDKRCPSSCGGDLTAYSHCTLINRNSETTSVKYRAIYDNIEMPWDWPVIVNYHEVKAFCHWKGPEYRAPTEAEHLRMRGDKTPPTCDVSCDPGFNAQYPANINIKYGSPSPVNLFEASWSGHYDVYGNLWEWGEDHFNGFPGFRSTYLYNDFSTPFFDGSHSMVMGGSWVSTGEGTSRYMRLAFRRHFFQHSGFRLVHSSSPPPVRLCKAEVYILGDGVLENEVSIPNFQDSCVVDSLNQQFEYETLQSLDNQLAREYSERVGCSSVIHFVESVIEKYNVGRSAALVLGSGGGFNTFMLTKCFTKVVGLDFSGRFIDAALSIQAGKEMKFGGGQLAVVPATPGVDQTRASFKQLTWIPNEIINYDLVLFEFFDRLCEPRGWMVKLWECVSSQGVVVMIGPDRSCIENYIGNWFKFLEEWTLTDRIITVWKLKDST